MNNIRIRLRLFVGKIPVLTVIICVIVLLFGKYRQMEYVRANETGVIEIENTEILPEQIFAGAIPMTASLYVGYCFMNGLKI